MINYIALWADICCIYQNSLFQIIYFPFFWYFRRPDQHSNCESTPYSHGLDSRHERAGGCTGAANAGGDGGRVLLYRPRYCKHHSASVFNGGQAGRSGGNAGIRGVGHHHADRLYRPAGRSADCRTGCWIHRATSVAVEPGALAHIHLCRMADFESPDRRKTVEDLSSVRNRPRAV